ncbi:HSP20-like chaperone [Kockiozyma suomiensis]|uniref:HSP20-like chaperone n=1 Tax=Kockiozyma suomiensis TaxID=1337062 RepID=UPI0033437BCE
MSLARILNSSPAFSFGPSRSMLKLLDDPFFTAPLSSQFQSPFASSLLNSDALTRTPSFDVKETEKEFVLQGELPGVEKKNLSLEFIDPQTLRVKGVVEKSHEFSSDPSQTDTANTAAAPATTEVATTSTPAAELTPAARSAGTMWATERVYGEFSRAFKFPSPVDAESVAASLKNGILSVKVPKVSQSPTAKRIEISTEE